VFQELCPLIKRFAQHIPSDQVIRYLLVGAWNTVFGFGCFFVFTKLLLHVMPSQPSLAASVATVVATITNITVSFIGYKLFVFKTEGNFLYEYARSFLVYLPSLLFNAVAIAPLTVLLRRTIPSHSEQAPYFAGAILAFVNVIISFFGHKHISFRDRAEAPPRS
jgi:putative flippase GtrA